MNAKKVRFPDFRVIDKYIFNQNGKEIALDILCQPQQANGRYLAVEVKNRDVEQDFMNYVRRTSEVRRTYPPEGLNLREVLHTVK